MKVIQKRNSSPEEFEDWKRVEKPEKWSDLNSSPPTPPTGTISDYSKEDLREPLLEDQGFICAYCMDRLENAPSTNIDHLFCRDDFPERTFDFSNFLAACNGKGKPKNTPPLKPHCDNAKDNSNLAIYPLMGNCEFYFSYDFEGNVFPKTSLSGTPEESVKEVIKTLGLSIRKLNNRRRDFINGFLFPEDIHYTKSDYKTLKRKLLNEKTGKFTPFNIAIVYLIDSLLKDMT